MLEIESGSNDPFAYMLTIVVLSAMGGSVSLSQIVRSVFSQIFIGLAAGSLLAWIAGSIMKRVHFGENGLDSVFLSGIALASYAIPSLLGEMDISAHTWQEFSLETRVFPIKKDWSTFLMP